MCDCELQYGQYPYHVKVCGGARNACLSDYVDAAVMAAMIIDVIVATFILAPATRVLDHRESSHVELAPKVPVR